MLNNVPLPNQSLGASQSLINQNFSVIDTAFTVNHVPYNDGSGDQGKHAFVQFKQEASAPSADAGDVSLYNYPSTLTSANELFLIKSDASTTIPITACYAATTGWSYLPSGILLKWGVTTTISTGSPFVYTYPTSASTPVFNNVFTVLLTPIDSNTGGAPITVATSIRTGTISATGFSIVYNGTAYSTTVVQYLAIGN